MTDLRRRLLLASLTPFTLFALLGVAAGRGWLGTAEMDSPSYGIRAWAADQHWLEGALLAVESAFTMDGLMVMAAVLAGWLLLRRQFRAGALVVLVMPAVRELSSLTKELFGRDRPAWQESELLHQASSYPSGHAAGVATLGGLVLVLAILGSRGRAVRLVTGVVTLVVLVVCADRLLLGRHYPTDLLGGILLATGLVLLGSALLLPLPGTAAEEAAEAEEAEETVTAVPEREPAGR